MRYLAAIAAIVFFVLYAVGTDSITRPVCLGLGLALFVFAAVVPDDFAWPRRPTA